MNGRKGERDRNDKTVTNDKEKEEKPKPKVDDEGWYEAPKGKSCKDIVDEKPQRDGDKKLNKDSISRPFGALRKW